VRILRVSGLRRKEKRVTVPTNGFLKAVWLDDGRIADVKMRHVVFRDVAKHPDRVDPLHREKRGRSRARGGLDQITPVHQSARHHSIERRHDLRIGEQRLDPRASEGRGSGDSR